VIFSILFVLNGCADQARVRPQAIQLETSDLSEIEHKLVFLSVDIEQGKTRLKMKILVALNQVTRVLAGHQQLVPMCELRNDFRHFRVDRMLSCAETEKFSKAKRS
jgi:hypothetical protein